MGTFKKAIDLFSDKTKSKMELLTRKLIIDIGVRLVEKSPVGDPSVWQGLPPKGYVGGRFRANWQYSFNNVVQGDLPDIDSSGNISVGRITSGAYTSPFIGKHYIVNNLPYAMRLETGWSKQAPAGMVTLTVMEFDSSIQSIVSTLK